VHDDVSNIVWAMTVMILGSPSTDTHYFESRSPSSPTYLVVLHDIYVL
jgi:hypothetical protein